MVRPPRIALLASVLALGSCTEETGRPTIHLVVPPDQQALFESYVEGLEGSVVVDVATDPAESVAVFGGVGIAVVPTSSGDGAYRIDPQSNHYLVRGDAPLGVQYGVSELLEKLGFGFYHPFRTHVPERLLELDPATLGVDHAPERAQRGLHLHTLHPIEGFFDFCEAGPDQLARATRVLDWVVKSRGNYVQWTPLDDALRDPSKMPAWKAHAQGILDAAHERGVRIGIGVQLFGRSNLQNAFDLVEAGDTDANAAIDGRLDLIADVPFDSVQLSFGEFLGADPAAFVATLDHAVAGIRQRWPGADASTVVHLGNYPDLQVDYMGETQLYYYLVKYAADPALVPWIHTVMYYDLYEDAGGAYGYDRFDGHLDYLYDRLRADQPVTYFPETAYWIAFDNSIPTYLPLYVRNRYLDLDRARLDANTMGFDDDFGHVLFSSGWEWGYWQNDWAALRTSYELPPRVEDVFESMWAPYGADGRALAGKLAELASLQKGALMDERLAAWMASRDWTFDLGDAIGVFSQPTRPSFEELLALPPAERDAFEADVVDRLAVFRDALAQNRRDVLAIGLPSGDPFVAEVLDGLEANVERVTFIHALLQSVLAHARGDAAAVADATARAEAAEARAGVVIDRRHADLHYPDAAASILAVERVNATTYDYGYLREAVTRCFYERERIEVHNLLTGENLDVPLCALL